MSAVLHPVERAESPSWAGCVLALLLLAMGAFIVGIGLGWIACDASSLHAPRWVICVCGSVFALGGIGVFATVTGRGAAAGPIVAAGVLTGLVLVCHWVAFAEGERRFTATTYVSGLQMERREVDEHTGRTAFAFAAVSLDLVLLLVAARALRERGRGR